MNASQRRIFRRAVSAALGLSVGQTVTKEAAKGLQSATLLRVSPTGGRNVAVKLRNNREAVWPLSSLQAA